MSLKDIGDWAVNGLAGVGFPALLGKYIYDLIKNRPDRIARRRARIEADLADATRDDKVKSSSVTTLEAQMVAMGVGFDQERQAKDRTIVFLTNRVETLEDQLTDRDRKLADALATIEELRTRLDELANEVRTQLAGEH